MSRLFGIIIKRRLMKIALYDVDSRIPNLVLMKISAYHKSQGDSIEWYSPLLKDDYDKIYASKVFKDSDNGYLDYDKENFEIGGSGSNYLMKVLPPEIEHIYPDYELYDCDYAMGFITRGCIRKCEFCIVPKKEGKIRKNAEITEFWKGQDKIKLLDNNILAYQDHIWELQILADTNCKIDFNQGLDIRLINHANAKILREIKKWVGYELRFAFDDPKLANLIKKKLDILKQRQIKRCRFYVLIGYNTTPKEDMERVNLLKELRQSVFVMPYDKSNDYQKRFARWVNRFFYKYQTFKQYLNI